MNEREYQTLSFFGKENFTSLQFSKDIFTFNWEISPGHAVMEHIHPSVDEVFEIVSGEITFKISGKRQVAKMGDKLTITKGIPHEVINESGEKAICKVSYLPAGDQGVFFDIGLFILKEKLAVNGSAALFFKMMFTAKQLNCQDFSIPANTISKVKYAVMWLPIAIYGNVAGWKIIAKRYKAFNALNNN